MMNYKSCPLTDRVTFLKTLQGSDLEAICSQMIGFTEYEADWKQAQNTILMCLRDPRPEVSALAVTCLGHIARIHGKIDKEIVKQQLASMYIQNDMQGRIEDALDDINSFAQ